MSNLEVESARQAMEASGEMDFIRAHAGLEQDTTPAAEEAVDTEETEVVEEVAEDDGNGENMENEGGPAAPDLSAEEEETLYLELDDATQTLIDTKYGGDINKALGSLADAQSLIGRQGNELGDLRRELQEALAGIRQDIAYSQPYPEWPDEYAEPGEAAAAYREIAEAAFSREDVDTFGNAVDAWMEADPVSASTYRDLKILQMQTAIGPTPAPVRTSDTDKAIIEAGVAQIQEKFPQVTSPEFQAEFDVELQKFPALKGLLWGEIPGTTPEQRIAALEETVTRVASRQVADTETKARRRVAVKRSEEARQARVEAKVASGESARIAEPEVERRTVPLGESGRVLDIDRLNAMLNPADRI